MRVQCIVCQKVLLETDAHTNGIVEHCGVHVAFNTRLGTNGQQWEHSARSYDPLKLERMSIHPKEKLRKAASLKTFLKSRKNLNNAVVIPSLIKLDELTEKLHATLNSGAFTDLEQGTAANLKIKSASIKNQNAMFRISTAVIARGKGAPPSVQAKCQSDTSYAVRYCLANNLPVPDHLNKSSK